MQSLHQVRTMTEQQQDALCELYMSAELDQLYEIAAALELEPWMHLVRSQRRFDNALHAKAALTHENSRTHYTARHEFRCAIEQLQYALVSVGITFDDVLGKRFQEMDAHNV